MMQFTNYFVGKIAGFDDAIKLFINPEDENKSVVVLQVNISKPTKKKDEEYYGSFLKTFKLFGKNAAHIGPQLEKNMDIIAEGFLDIEDDREYENEQGETVKYKGREYVFCRNIKQLSNLYRSSSSSEETVTEAKKPKKTSLSIKSPNKIKLKK